MSEDLTILCTGDIHLGRHPTRIPSELDGRDFSPKAIWRSTAEEAINRDVDAVVITGDVVDRENRYFEAYGAFEEGAQLLDEAGLPVVVVSGNHDFDVLPQMVEDLELDTLRLLGHDGTWNRWTFTQDGEPLAHFDGWSFPDQHVVQSPIGDYELDRPTDAPLVGVLHADLDVQESWYAPVSSSELRGTPADAWLLGHIHKPAIRIDADPFVLYPGSPQPLDPGERGTHGPWVLSLDERGGVEVDQVSLASLRYDEYEVDVSEAEDAKSVPPLVSDAIKGAVRVGDDTGAMELLLARVRLSGRTSAHAELVELQSSLEAQMEFTEGSLPVRVETLDVATQPKVDLEELSQGNSPVAYLAELLLAIEHGELGKEHPRLVGDALEAMQRARSAGAYKHLRSESQIERPDEDMALRRIQHQARLLLDTLLDQKERTA